MAISGHTSPQLVINSTGNVQNYSGNATVGSSSDLVIIMVQAWDANALEDPANWTVTLGGGSALTASTKNFNTSIDFAVAVYEVTSPPTGTPAVAVDLGGAGRGCQALVWVISGHDTTTPVAGRGVSTSYSSDVATQAFTRTTTADNNVLLSMLGVRETVTTSEFSMSGGTLISAANTGTGDTSDITCAYGYHVVATAGSTTDTYNWTDAGRAHVAWVEINVATASGTSVNLDTLAYTETVNSLTAQVDTPVAFDTLAYSEALPDLTAAVNTPVALDSLGYTASLPDMTLAVPAVVALDSLSYAASLPDVSVSTGTTVALDALSYSASLPDATATVGTPVALDALAYSTALPDVGVAASATVALDTLEYTAALPDVVLSTGTQEQPGGWLPIKYVDRDGNVVDLDDVEEAVEEIAETAPPKRRADLRRISDRVIAALGRQEAPRRDDVRLLRRALAEREAALEALNAAILAQQLLDDEITALLLAA